jgi:hypothetical protein
MPAIDPVFAGAALGWFARERDSRVILTVDVSDFNMFRAGRNRRFEFVKWF